MVVPVEVYIIKIVADQVRQVGFKVCRTAANCSTNLIKVSIVVPVLFVLSCAPLADSTGTDTPIFSAIVVSQDLAVGENRVAFGLVDLDGMPIRADQASVATSSASTLKISPVLSRSFGLKRLLFTRSAPLLIQP